MIRCAGTVVLALLIAVSAVADTRAPATSACRTAIERALPELRAADVLLVRKEMRAANARLDAGLRTLGNAYHRPGMIDDSGLSLVVALTDERRGRLERAARIKRHLLSERLKLCGHPQAS